MAVCNKAGPAIAFLSFDVSEADEERSGIPRLEAKDVLGDDRKVPCINLLYYYGYLTKQPNWEKLKYCDKQVVLMNQLKQELAAYGPDDTVCVFGFFVLFVEDMRQQFLDQYSSKVYLVSY